MADPIDQLVNSYAAQRQAGPETKSREVTVEDFQKVLDSTPLFMNQTPDSVDNEESNYVMEALRSLVFDGEGDGKLPSLHGEIIADRKRSLQT